MTDSGYITDSDFDDDLEAVREHYEAVRGVIENMAMLGDAYPTLGFAGNAGWYMTRDTDVIEQIESGYTKRARCTTFERDFEHIVNSQLGADGRNRELFNISSWKDPDVATAWKHCTEAPDREWSNDGHPPGYEDLRGFGFWFDLDLEHKDGRAALTDDELATVEQVQQRVIDAVADAYNVDSVAIYGLDSGGGAYIYGPPEATLKIAEYLDDPQEREWFFDDLADRINDGPLADEIESIIDEEGADDLLDPDWIQNKNRQTKSPGSLHHSHDIIVTPLRDRHPGTGDLTGRVNYTPTQISEFTRDDIKSLEAWADGLTTIEHTDAVGPLVKTLYPEHTDDDDTEDWRDIVDLVVERCRRQHEQAEKIRQERQDAIEQLVETHPETETEGELTRSPSGLASATEIVTSDAELSAAIDTIDVRDVVKKHASEKYDTSSRPAEVTFKPSWRGSNSGQSVAIKNGENNFIDNGCSASGGPVLAYALGEGIIRGGKKAATRSLSGEEFGETLDAMREDGYNIPVLVPAAGDEYDQTPLWGLRKAALALGVIDSRDEFKEHETDDGETYLGFDAATYNSVLDALDEEGVEHGRETVTDDSDSIKEVVVEYNDQYDAPEDVPDDIFDSYDTAPWQEKPSVVPWEEIRQTYAGNLHEDAEPDPFLGRYKAQRHLEIETDWMCVTESDRLWKYNADRGIFEKNGEAEIGSRLVLKLGPHYTRSEKGEIIDRVKENNRVKRSTINARQMDSKLLCVGNGVVNLKTGELLPHSPTYRFVRGLDVNLATDDNDLTEDPDAVLSFLDDVTGRKADRDTLLDHLAHGFMPGHPYRAFVVTYGPGGNGKTQVARLFRGFVGDENASSVEIDELVNDDFATSDLVGNFINWGDDMSGDGGGQLEDISTLKKASGGSSIRSNEKYEKTFDFVNEAALFFGANEPPRFAEEKASVKDRLYPIQMPYRFVSDPDPDNPKEKQKVPDFSQQLLNDDAAMRGLLRLAVEHAQDLIERNGEYSMPEGPQERFESYTVTADPIVRFARMAFEQGSAGDRVSKEDAYHVYRQVMDIWGERTTSEDSFKRYLPRSVSAEIETSRSRALAGDGDDRVRVWKRLKWTDDAAEFMPDWIAERYSDQFGDTDTDTADTADVEDDEPTALAARDPGYGHEFDVTVSVVNDGEYTRKTQGRLEGPQGLYISYVVPAGNDIEMSAYEHSTVHMDSVTLRTNDDGLLEAVITDAVAIERVGVSPDTDTDDDDDADGDTDSDTDETDTETSETTESPDSPETPQSSSADTPAGEATADGGEIEAGNDAADITETDASPLSAQPDSIKDEDESTQAERLQTLKDMLHESTKNRRWTTADELEADLGWDRSIIDGYLEKLQRESTLMRTDKGCKYWK